MASVASSYLTLLLERRVAEALKAAESIAPGRALEFVTRQASERAYAMFKYSLDERMEALRLAGELMSCQQRDHKTADRTFVNEHRIKLVNVVSLLRCVEELNVTEMSARDWQILGRATGYCGLLSHCSTDIYPYLSSYSSLVLQIPKLSLLIHRDLTALGPAGPLESDAEISVRRNFQVSRLREAERARCG
jgi:hypothetical protein